MEEPFNASCAEIRALAEELDAGKQPCSNGLSALIKGFRSGSYSMVLGESDSDKYYRNLTAELVGTLFAALCEGTALNKETGFPAEKRLYECVEKIYMTLYRQKINAKNIQKGIYPVR